jgi:hypothetical protein
MAQQYLSEGYQGKLLQGRHVIGQLHAKATLDA